MTKNGTHNLAPQPNVGNWLTRKRRVVALAAAATTLVGAVSACGSEIGGTMGTGKYSVGDTDLVIRNANGQVLITDVSSAGQLRGNRYGWSSTTVAQATMAGLATNHIGKLPPSPGWYDLRRSRMRRRKSPYYDW